MWMESSEKHVVPLCVARFETGHGRRETDGRSGCVLLQSGEMLVQLFGAGKEVENGLQIVN